MSRHRNIRNYAYEEDMYEDVYGHSVEEHDLCVSPTTAQQFLFHRGESAHPNLSSFMEESRGYDEEDTGEHHGNEEHLGAAKDYKTPKLDRESEAKLRSCMDEFRSILGDHCDEDQASYAILKHNFDLERAIDEVLSKGGTQDLRSREVSRTEKDVSRSLTPSNQLCPTQSVSMRVGGLEGGTCTFPGLTGGERSSLLAKEASHTKYVPEGKGGLAFVSGDSTSLKPNLLQEIRPGKEPSKIVSLQELSKSHEETGTSMLSKLSANGYLGTPGDHDGSLRDQMNKQSGTSLLGRLLAESHVGTPGDKTGLSALGGLSVSNKTGSSGDHSHMNTKLGGASLLSQLSMKGQHEVSRDQANVSPLSGLSEAGKGVSLRDLSQKYEKSSKSLLSQLPKGQLGIPRFQAGESPLAGLSAQGTLVSLRELSQANEKSGTSLLSLLSTKGQHGTPGDAAGFPPFGVSPLRGPGKSLEEPDQPRCSQDIDLSVSLKRNQPKKSSKIKSKSSNSTKSLQKSFENLSLRPALDEADGLRCMTTGTKDDVEVEMRNCTTDVKDGFQTRIHKSFMFGCDIMTLVSTGSPTMFAHTLFVKYAKPRDVKVPVVMGGFLGDRREQVDIEPFDFSTPSPDDIVKSKQKEALKRK